MKGKVYLTAACAAACLSTITRAAIIDFEADTPGYYPNGFSAVGHPTVKFTDTVRAGLNIFNYGSQGIGQSLAIEDDGDGSKLQIDFTTPVSALSLWFGNDDYGWASSSDLAWLEIWNGGSLLATLSLAMNLNDDMDQSIGYSGGPFDRAFFWYGDAQGSPYTTGPFGNKGLIEIVDMIEYTAVPEPASALATAALLGLGAFGLRRWRNRA
jgi:hypothetical protein